MEYELGQKIAGLIDKFGRETFRKFEESNNADFLLATLSFENLVRKVEEMIRKQEGNDGLVLNDFQLAKHRQVRERALIYKSKNLIYFDAVVTLLIRDYDIDTILNLTNSKFKNLFHSVLEEVKAEDEKDLRKKTPFRNPDKPWGASPRVSKKSTKKNSDGKPIGIEDVSGRDDY